MRGFPEKENPLESQCNLPGATIQEGYTWGPVLSPAQKEQCANRVALGVESYANFSELGNHPGIPSPVVLADFREVEETAKTPGKVHDLAALLGNKGRNPASHVRRGFQTSGEGREILERVDQETGEIIRFEVTPNGERLYKSPQFIRAERYGLKSVVNRLYPSSETAKCSRAVIPDQSSTICFDSEHHRAFYKGLRRCSSVWLCPLCAAKITERRRSELVAAVGTAKAMGWQVMLMTCTIPHGLGDDVKPMLKLMLKAWRKMTDDRSGKELRKLLDLRGTIRTLEVTDGDNGFHPHFHVLLFIGSTFSPESVQAGFLPLWQQVCVKVGLPCPSDAHGLRVDDGSWAARYASKWGLEDEMVRGHTKTARGDKGKTPWDLLRDVLATGSQRSEERFRLYADAFKGARQLRWSPGLKALLAVQEVSDEELTAIEEENAYVLAKLTEQQWRAVLFMRFEAALLDVAENNPQDLQTILTSVVLSARSKGLRTPLGGSTGSRRFQHLDVTFDSS